jgi:hypothetical protein
LTNWRAGRSSSSRRRTTDITPRDGRAELAALARAVQLGTVAVRANERLVGGIALAVGAILFYLVMLDQGQVADLLLASGVAGANHLHEFFHDGRHLGGVPCH